MSRAATVYVCSEDATEVVGTAEVVECYLESDDPAIILRGVSFDAERVLSCQVRALQHDIDYYKKARENECLAHSQPVPGRTITESEAARLWYDANNSVRDAWPMSLLDHGITVIPDPVPTEAEKLETLIDGHLNVGGITPKSLAEYLAGHGVTAGGEA